MDTRTDSTFSRYTLGFYHFSVLPQIRPFSGTCGDNFWLLAQILPFTCIRLDSTIFRYSHRFDLDFGTRGECFLTLARILPFPRTRSDSTGFRYTHRFDPFSVLVGTVFGYSHGFYLIPVHARILSFFGTPIDSTLFQYS